MVYKRVTRSHLIWKSHLLSFHTKLLSIFQVYFQLEVGVGRGLVQDGTCGDDFFTHFFSLFPLTGLGSNTGCQLIQEYQFKDDC